MEECKKSAEVSKEEVKRVLGQMDNYATVLQVMEQQVEEEQSAKV